MREPTTANALDATLTLSASGLMWAQDLTREGRLGLDAPRVLSEATQDRLVPPGALDLGGVKCGSKSHAFFRGRP
ncbi:MAG: hypothetical protein JOZ30_05990 [Hyphomicrobiales bacterium]|nr:hypothetical protein [Hyphomicrobiales bacterium]